MVSSLWCMFYLVKSLLLCRFPGNSSTLCWYERQLYTSVHFSFALVSSLSQFHTKSHHVVSVNCIRSQISSALYNFIADFLSGAGSMSGGGKLIVVHVSPCKITASVSVPCTTLVTAAPYVGTKGNFICLCTFHLPLFLPYLSSTPSPTTW